MEIGKRLRGLRLAKNLSQGDIEERTGLLRCYISRVEGGHTLPSLETLRRLATALDLELYQLFYFGKAKPSAPKASPEDTLDPREWVLVKVFRRVSPPDQKLLLELGRYSARKLRAKT